MTDSIACPACGAPATGKFCSSCGTSLAPRACPACGTSAAADARFCRGCGSAMPATRTAAEPRTPWIVAAILSVVAVAAIVYSAGRRADAQGPAMPNAGNAGAATTAPTALGPAPDISNLTPREQFARLNDRVMTAAEAGDSTTVITFWPMAAGAYDNLLPGDRDIDARYHMATLHLLVGRFPAALALADTIEAESPGNLLGWYVRGIVAEYQNDATALATARREFTRRFDAEIAKDLEEYRHHGDQLRAYRAAPIGGN